MDHYSYTQLSTYLQCPLKYKYHYLDGWQETEDKASLVFGRVFQSAVEAQFLVADSVQFFTERWAEVKDLPLEYANGDSWEKMLEQGPGAAGTVPRGQAGADRRWPHGLSGQVPAPPAAQPEAFPRLCGCAWVCGWAPLPD